MNPTEAENMRDWLESKAKTPEELAEDERRRRARENRAGFAQLAADFGKAR